MIKIVKINKEVISEKEREERKEKKDMVLKEVKIKNLGLI